MTLTSAIRTTEIFGKGGRGGVTRGSRRGRGRGILSGEVGGRGKGFFDFNVN